MVLDKASLIEGLGRGRTPAAITSSTLLACRPGLQELHEQLAHFPRLLLLDPVPCPVQQMTAEHLRARLVLHLVHVTRSLIDAPVAFPRDEHRRHIDGAAGEYLQLGNVLAA